MRTVDNVVGKATAAQLTQIQGLLVKKPRLSVAEPAAAPPRVRTPRAAKSQVLRVFGVVTVPALLIMH